MKRGVFLVAIILLVLPLSFATDIGACQAISASGSYTLNTSLVSSDGNHCVIIGGNNITLDLAGFSISNSTNNWNASIYINGSAQENVTVMNGRVNNSYDGIYIANSQNISIINITANNNEDNGIHLESSDNSSLINNTAFSNGDGILLVFSHNLTLTGNNASVNSNDGFDIACDGADDNLVFEDNIANDNDQDGYHLQTCFDLTFTSSNASNNDFIGYELEGGSGDNITISDSLVRNNVEDGVNAISYTNVTIFNNIITNNSEAIELSDSAQVNISFNTMYNNSYGIYADSITSFNTIYLNTINDSTTEGILLLNSDAFNVSFNNLHDNLAGIVIGNTSNSNITSNKVNSSSNQGITWGEGLTGDNNTFFNNTITDSGDLGLGILSGSNINISNNTLENNVGPGIYLESVSSSNIDRNIIRENGQGISGANPPFEDNNFTENIIEDTTSDGTSLTNAVSNRIENNTISNSGGFGIIITEGEDITIASNTLNGNQFGIEFLGTPGVSYLSSFTDNEVYNNADVGVYLETYSDVDLSNNEIYDNEGNGTHILNSDNIIINRDQFHNNEIDLVVEVNDGTTRTLNLSNVIFDSPDGDLEGYTNISINDTMVDYAFSINWSSEPQNPPSTLESFDSKYINITNLTGNTSIDNLTWNWQQAELSSSDDESGFVFYKYNASGWVELSVTLDTTANTFNIQNLNLFSVFGILKPVQESSGGGGGNGESTQRFERSVYFGQTGDLEIPDLEDNSVNNFIFTFDICNSGSCSVTARGLSEQNIPENTRLSIYGPEGIFLGAAEFICSGGTSGTVTYSAKGVLCSELRSDIIHESYIEEAPILSCSEYQGHVRATSKIRECSQLVIWKDTQKIQQEAPIAQVQEETIQKQEEPTVSQPEESKLSLGVVLLILLAVIVLVLLPTKKKH